MIVVAGLREANRCRARGHVPAPPPLGVDAQIEHGLRQHQPVDNDVLTDERPQPYAHVEALRCQQRLATHIRRRRQRYVAHTHAKRREEGERGRARDLELAASLRAHLGGDLVADEICRRRDHEEGDDRDAECEEADAAVDQPDENHIRLPLGRGTARRARARGPRRTCRTLAGMPVALQTDGWSAARLELLHRLNRCSCCSKRHRRELRGVAWNYVTLRPNAQIAAKVLRKSRQKPFRGCISAMTRGATKLLMGGELPQRYDTFFLVWKNVRQHTLAPHNA